MFLSTHPANCFTPVYRGPRVITVPYPVPKITYFGLFIEPFQLPLQKDPPLTLPLPNSGLFTHPCNFPANVMTTPLPMSLTTLYPIKFPIQFVRRFPSNHPANHTTLFILLLTPVQSPIQSFTTPTSNSHSPRSSPIPPPVILKNPNLIL